MRRVNDRSSCLRAALGLCISLLAGGASSTRTAFYPIDADGWVDIEQVAQTGRPDKKVYAVSPTGRAALVAWLATATPMEPLRSELSVKMRGASYGDRAAVLAVVRDNLAEHRARLEHYRQLATRDYPAPDALTDHDLDAYLVLRGGTRLEEFWVDWLTEYLAAHSKGTP